MNGLGKQQARWLYLSYSYDLHGWVAGIEAGRGTDTLFSESIRYSSPQKPGAVPLYSGNISEIASLQYEGPLNTYSYSYDGTSRLADARHFIGNSSVASNTDTEKAISYDANGNIIGLERLMRFGDSQDLAMQYSGNRLMSVTDGNSAPMLYDYDADGNLASDGHTGFEFSYNILNLPMSAEDSADGSTMTYTYLSDGTKLKAVSDGGAGLTYRGSFVYGLSSGGGCTLESVATDEGRIVMDGTAVKDEWHVRDHVGNVRSVVWLNAPAGTSVSASILEQNDYLPFGTRLPGSRTDQSNRYRLGGKEEQAIAGMDLGLLDFGARYYDAYVGRWSAIDPLAHKYFGMSPYNYCGNDPVNFVDPDGSEKIIAMIHAPKMNEPKYQRANKQHLYDITKPTAMDVLQQDQALYECQSELIYSMRAAYDYQNLCMFYAHGASNGKVIDFVDSENEHHTIGANGLSKYLYENSEVVKANMANNAGSIIVLNCCNTGNGKESLGCQLSNYMKGSLVIAPSTRIHADGSSDNKSGQWNIYYNGTLVSSFVATAQAYSTYLDSINVDPQKILEQQKKQNENVQ